MPPAPAAPGLFSSRTSVDDAADALDLLARLAKSDAAAYIIGRVRFECASSPASVDRFDPGILQSDDFRAVVASFPGLPSSGYGGPDGIVCPLLEKEATFRSLAELSSVSPLRLTAVIRQLLVNIDCLFFLKTEQHSHRQRLGADAVDWAGVRSMFDDPLLIADALVHPDTTRFIASIRDSGDESSGTVGDNCGESLAEFILLCWVPRCDERPMVSSLMALDRRIIAGTGSPVTVFDRSSPDSASGHLAAFFSSVVASRLCFIGNDELASRSLLYRFLRDRHRLGP